MKKILIMFGGLVLLLAVGCGEKGGGARKDAGAGTGVQNGMVGKEKDGRGRMEDSAGLVLPAAGLVLSEIPVTTLQKETVEPEVNVVGTIGYDTRSVNTISMRISGRIEKMYVRYRYQHVHAGMRIMEVYSPAIATAEEELLFLLQHDAGNAAFFGAARKKLLLLGVDAGQLAAVEKSGRPSPTVDVYSSYTGHIHEAGNIMPGTGQEGISSGGGMDELPLKEGMYVQQGQIVFQVYNTDRCRVELNIFPGQESSIRQGDAVKVIPETAPSKMFRGKVDLVEPFFRKGDKTLTARSYFDNSRLMIPVGSAVKATIYGHLSSSFWLPAGAVLDMGMGKAVFVREGKGFRGRKVETGMVYGDKVQVLSGLSGRDTVAANASFLMDSESFIKINKRS